MKKSESLAQETR